MKFIVAYKKENKKDSNFEKNAYASFCIGFVNQIKEKLNFIEEKSQINEKGEDKDIIKYTIDMPVIRNGINRVCKRTGKKEIIERKLEKPVKTVPEEDKKKCLHSANSVN